MRPPPPLLTGLWYGWLALTTIFLATGPWRVGSTQVKQLNVLLGLGVLAFACAAISRNVRRHYGEVLRGDVHFPRRTLWISLCATSLVLLRLVWSKWRALEVNAWDFTINFDRPIQGTLHGALLYSEEFGMSMLGNHPTWLSFAFVPLYAIYETPYWLLLVHALAVAAGVAAAFVLIRHETGDDLIAVLLAATFLVNRFVAKATQYVFHPEIFYPLGFFVLVYAFLRRKRLPFALALLLMVSIKEDAIIPIFGFAVVAAFVYKRWRWGLTAFAVAALVFAVDYFYVLPHFSRGEVWYANYWSSYGSTPIEALGGMLRQPLKVLGRVVSGSSDMFLSLALMPLLGPEWLIAAIPGLFIYGSSDMDKLHWFTLYYSMPVLPAVFFSIPFALKRIGRGSRYVSRILAIVVLVTTIAIGTGHILYEPHPDYARIEPLFAHVADVPSTWVQGSIFPYVGYSRKLHVYNERASVDGRSAFLLSAELDPYFYDRAHFEELIARLSRDPRYRRIDSGTLVLFVPK